MARFIRDVICAPYSLPVGIINSNLKTPFKFCSKTITKELTLKEKTQKSKRYSGAIGTDNEDITTMTNYDILMRGIQDILRNRENQVPVQNIATQQLSEIHCDLVVPFKVDPTGSYDSMLERIEEIKVGGDGKKYPLPVFKCCPSIEQNTVIYVSSWNEIKDIDIEDIYTEIDLYTKNEYIEQGSENPVAGEISSLVELNIDVILKQKIREVIKNATTQNASITQSLNYIDRYQRCQYHMDEYGELWASGKVLKQSIDVDILASNIIHSTNKLIMNSKTKIDSKSTTVLTKLTNYRVIVCSLLLNVIVLFLCYKAFSSYL